MGEVGLRAEELREIGFRLHRVWSAPGESWGLPELPKMRGTKSAGRRLGGRSLRREDAALQWVPLRHLLTQGLGGAFCRKMLPSLRAFPPETSAGTSARPRT